MKRLYYTFYFAFSLFWLYCSIPYMLLIASLYLRVQALLYGYEVNNTASNIFYILTLLQLDKVFFIILIFLLQRDIKQQQQISSVNFVSLLITFFVNLVFVPSLFSASSYHYETIGSILFVVANSAMSVTALVMAIKLFRLPKQSE